MRSRKSGEGGVKKKISNKLDSKFGIVNFAVAFLGRRTKIEAERAEVIKFFE